MPADLSDADEVSRVAKAVGEKFDGSMNVLINNSGMGAGGKLAPEGGAIYLHPAINGWQYTQANKSLFSSHQRPFDLRIGLNRPELACN